MNTTKLFSSALLVAAVTSLNLKMVDLAKSEEMSNSYDSVF